MRRTFILLLFFSGCDMKTDGYIDAIGNGYQLYYAHKKVDLINDSNNLLIKDIRACVKDDSFLLAYRRTGDDQLKDSLQYWIVKNGTDSVYGPFNRLQLERKKAELRVDPSLVINVKDSLVRY